MRYNRVQYNTCGVWWYRSMLVLESIRVLESSTQLESSAQLEYPLSQEEEKKALSKTASEARGQKWRWTPQHKCFGFDMQIIFVGKYFLAWKWMRGTQKDNTNKVGLFMVQFQCKSFYHLLQIAIIILWKLEFCRKIFWKLLWKNL